MSLDSLIKELYKDRPKLFVIITDVTTGRVLAKFIDGETILKSNSSIKDYFLEIPKKYNTSKVSVTKHLRNGVNRYRKISKEPLILNFQQKTNSNQPQQPAAEVKKQQPMNDQFQQSQNYQQNPGLFGTGLSGADILNLKTKELDYERLKDSLNTTNEAIRILRQQNDSLAQDLRKANADLAIAESKKEVEIDKVRGEKTPMISDKTIEQVAPLLLNVLEKFTPKSNAEIPQSQGLAGVENVPGWKQQFITSILSKEVNQSVINKAYFTIKGMLENADFVNELDALLFVHDLIAQQPLQKVQ